LARKLGFRIIVVDDRAEFANADRFPDVDEIYAIPFERAVKQINTTFATHIVILTRGHTHDRLVLEAMLRKPHAYLGMIGSIKKRDIIYEALLKSGFSPDMLSAVFSPIGLDIGAETPDEIAFSIMAELISIRSRKRKSLTTASTLKDKTPFAVL
jgi:xanthine dehydrogenase accessory factor